MNLIRHLVLAVVSLQCLWWLHAADLDLGRLRGVDIVTLNQMSVHRTNGTYVLSVNATFRNTNSEPVGLRNGEFKAHLRSRLPSDAPMIDLGKGRIAVLQLPPAREGKSGLATNVIEVNLGAESNETVGRMVQLWNMVGDPAQVVELHLKGSAEFGQALPNGWVFDPAKRIGAELPFVATIQRQVLLY